MRDLEKSKVIHEAALLKARAYLKSERELLATLIEVERDRTFELHGFTHLTPYCIKALGLGEDIAKCLVRIVRKSHHVPELAESVLKGEVSLYKAKVIASIITPENEDEWLAKAAHVPKAKLEREVSEQSGVNKKRVVLGLSHEAQELLTRARETLSSKLKTFASEEETIEWALSEVIKKHDPVEKAARAEKRRESQPVNSSRDHSFKLSVKHEVTRRDQERCQYIYTDGTQCDERKWLDRHHIIHRRDGGPDTLENLVTLCSGHHRIMHRQH